MGDYMGCKLSLTFSFLLVASLVFSGIQIRTVKADSNTWQVGTSTDDAHIYDNDDTFPPWDTFSTSYAYSRHSSHFTTEWHGSCVRFTSVNIPQGATINTAVVSVLTDNSSYGDRAGFANTTITGETVANAPTFSTLANYHARSHTGNSTDWDWDSPAQDTWINTTDISSVIQEIIDNSSWSSGNALALFLLCATDETNSGLDDVCEAYDSDPVKAPKLYVTWTPSGQDLSFSLFENFNTWESMASSKELAFKLYEPFNLWSYLATSKEQSFTFFENFNVWSIITMASEGVALDLYFTFFEGFNAWASIGAVVAEEITLEDVYGLAALGFIMAIVAICLAVAFKKK